VHTPEHRSLAVLRRSVACTVRSRVHVGRSIARHSPFPPAPVLSTLQWSERTRRKLHDRCRRWLRLQLSRWRRRRRRRCGCGRAGRSACALVLILLPRGRARTRFSHQRWPR
jgi:hypothetical protein